MENHLRRGSDRLRFRGGYTTRRNKIDGLSGASFGVGLNFLATTVDYAWVPFGELGDSHQVTLVWKIPPLSLNLRDELDDKKNIFSQIV